MGILLLLGAAVMNSSPSGLSSDDHKPTIREATPAVASKDNDTEEKERHKAFVRALERHSGPNWTGQEWHSMARELRWTVDRVQAYAQEYLSTLSEIEEQDDQNEDNHSLASIDEDTNNGGILNDSWSFEEAVLFDTLLARYLRPGNPETAVNEPTWEERVAAQLPGRTALEVRKRAERMHGIPPES